METSHPELRSLSLRDPDGSLFNIESHLIRQVHAQGKSSWEKIKKSPTLQKFVNAGSFVRSWEMNDIDIERLLQEFPHVFSNSTGDFYLGHEKIPFVSYPYEWAPEMLQTAGVLTLDLAEQLANENLGLKDATPFNVLFSGCNPIFVDLLSVEARDPRNSLWVAYSQFSKTFLNPLLAYQHLGIPLKNTFLLSREGLTASAVFEFAPLLKKLHPALFSKITLPALLENWSDKKLGYCPEMQKLMDPEKAQFTLKFLLRSAKKSISNLSFDHHHHRTQFKHYMGNESPYSKESFAAKEILVKKWLSEFSQLNVLDVGCNNGHFSRLAAGLGRSVVAIDSETELISKTWESCRKTHPSILPLIIDLANPSPASGWNNEEHESFLSRAEGKFDCVLMLAVIHHLLTTESILLPHIIKLAHRLSSEYVILEWVETSDPMFQHLAKGRDYKHLTTQFFESQCSPYFQIATKETLPCKTRTLYCLKRKPV
ncbi:MAG: class I SAM-dependent methyltransferase [Deltaproteobacteria bacterium]